eukprot:TRINITY_DN8694_c0_g4_i1.p1 TRINITY_DN8694_c0_g4~~TRINITY_DN8694_c0_g4_i1.p1  ORF type:complete len:243 (-),score=37.15 TRINITY_DN8694_c0_g4_i1:867-1595(-)
MNNPQKGGQADTSSNMEEKKAIYAAYSSLSNFQSASTLQHSVTTFAFPKAERFPKVKVETASAMYDLHSTLENRGTSFGYGHKKIMSEAQLKIAQYNPPPDRYHLKSDFEAKNKGRSLGLSYEAYKNCYLPNNNILSPQMAKEIPGPGTYKVRDEIGKDKRQSSMSPRGKMFNELFKSFAPPPNTYDPRLEVATPTRFKKISFGVGPRPDINRSGTKSPGPGAYDLPTLFDTKGKKWKKFTF